MANQKLSLGISVTADVKQAQTELNKLQSSLRDLITRSSRSDMNVTKEMREAAAAAKELQLHMAQAMNPKTGTLELDKLNMSLKSSGKTLTDFSQKMLRGGEEGQRAFADLAKTITSTQAPTARLGGMVEELATTFKTALKYQVSYGAINAVTNGIREAVNYAKDLNGTLNDIRIVTGKSADEADRLAKNAQKAAKNLSTSANDLLQAQLIYFQQGDSEAMASMKGEITTKAAKVAGVEAQQMSEYLTAVWNSYKVGSGELELFVDKLAAVGAATATSLEEISTAMTKVAATANTVGVSYDQLTATIATISSVTRTSAESVGTAMKTIYARMGDLKIGKKDEDGLALGSVSEQLKAVGIEILDENKNLRDMGIVVEEVGEKWQGWTEAQRTAVAQAIAGKRQYTQLMALFENWDMYTETKGVSEGANGALEDQFKIWSESWEAASNRVKVATEGMYSNLLNDDVMIKFTDTLAYAVNLLDTVLDSLGGIPGILALIASQILRIKGVAIEETFADMKRNLSLMIFPNKTMSHFEQIKGTFKQLKVDMNFDELQPSMQGYVNKLSDINTLQATLAKHSNNLTTVQKLGFEQQIEMVNQLHISLEETLQTIDKMDLELQKLSQANNLNLSKADREMIMKSNQGPIIKNSGLQGLSLQKGEGKKRQIFSGDALNGIIKSNKGYQNWVLSANNVKAVQSQLNKIFGEASPVVQRLNTELEKGSNKGNAMKMAFKLLSGEASEVSVALDLLNINTEELRNKIIEAVPEADTLFRQIESGAKKTSPMVEKLGHDIEDTAKKNKVGWSQIGSGLLSAASGAMSFSSSVNSIWDAFEQGASVGEKVQSIAGGVMSVMSALMMALSTGNPILIGLTLIIATIGGVVTAVERWHKTTKEKLEDSNQKLEEIQNNINNIISEIDKLQEKQKTASGIISQALDSEIERQRELLRIEQERQKIEEEKNETLTRKEAVDKMSKYGQIAPKVKNTQGIDIFLDSFDLTDEQKRNLVNLSLEGTQFRINDDNKNLEQKNVSPDGKVTYEVVGIVKPEYKNNTTTTAGNSELSEEFFAVQTAAQNLKRKPNSYDADLEFREALNANVGYLANNFGQYASEFGETGKMARNAIFQELTEIMNLLPSGEDKNEFLLSKLFTINPETFSSFDKFQKLYGDFFRDKLGVSEEKLKEIWKSYNGELTAATVNAKKYNTTITSMNAVVNKTSSAVKELNENNGKLSGTTISELETEWGALGDQAKNYADQLWLAQGNQKEMNRILQEATQAVINEKIATGSFIGQTKEQIEADLKAIGVVDAKTKAGLIYKKAQEQMTIQEGILAGKITGTGEAFLDSAVAYGVSTEAAQEYLAQQIAIENTDLDLSDQIKKIRELGVEWSSSYGQAAAYMGLMNHIGKVGHIKVAYTDATGKIKTKDYTTNSKGSATEQYLKDSTLPDNTTVSLYTDKTSKNPLNTQSKSSYDKNLKDAMTPKPGDVTVTIKVSETSPFGGTADSGKEKTLKEKLDEGLDDLVSGYENRTKRNVTRLVKEIGEDGKKVLVEKVFDDIPTAVDIQEYLKQMISSGEYTSSEIDDLWSQLDEIWDGVIEHEKKQAQLIKDAADGANDLATLETDYAEALDNVNLAKEHVAQSLANSSQNRPYTREQELEDIENTLAAYNEANKILENQIKEIEAEGEAYIKASEFEAYSGHSGEVAARESILAKTEQKKFQIMQNKLKAYDWLVELGKASEEDRADYAKSLEDEYFDWLRSEELDIAKLKRDLIKEAADYEFEQWKEEKEREKAELDAKASILEKSFSTTNSITEAQHELNKELQKSLTMYQYLDEDTRKLLFNTEDYVALSSELANIQKEVDKVTASYLMNIQGKTAEQIEDLTKQYERQTETLMKQYEIKKAEFEIEKKRLELNNTLNERNTRMFVNGQWTWVADANAVAQAQEQLAEAEYQKSKLETEAAQKASLNAINGQSDALSLQIKEVEKSFKDFKDALDGKDKGLVQAIKEAGDNIDAYSKALIQKITGITGVNYTKKSTDTFDPLGNFSKMQSTSSGMSDGSSLVDYIIKRNLEGKFFAAGTDNAPGGISRINEKGIEMWATKYGQLVELNPGDKIFNHDQFDFLYKFSKNPTEALRNINNNSAQAIDNRITIGGIEVAGNSEEGEALRSILTRLIGNR